MTVLFSLTKPVGKLTIGLLIKNASFALTREALIAYLGLSLLDGTSSRGTSVSSLFLYRKKLLIFDIPKGYLSLM